MASTHIRSARPLDLSSELGGSRGVVVAAEPVRCAGVEVDVLAWSEHEILVAKDEPWRALEDMRAIRSPRGSVARVLPRGGWRR